MSGTVPDCGLCPGSRKASLFVPDVGQTVMITIIIHDYQFTCATAIKIQASDMGDIHILHIEMHHAQ